LYSKYLKTTLIHLFDSFQDPVSKKTCYGRVVFQVRIKPGSYQVGKQTVLELTEKSQNFDPHFSNAELECSTIRRGVIILVGILVKVEDEKTK
jgi:hypothetical protein